MIFESKGDLHLLSCHRFFWVYSPLWTQTLALVVWLVSELHAHFHCFAVLVLTLSLRDYLLHLMFLDYWVDFMRTQSLFV